MASAVPTLEEQLATLVRCGVRLRSKDVVDSVLGDWSREQIEAEPYELLLVALGNEEQPLAENIWHFDTECIEDHGAYVRIATALRDMAGGDLPLTEVDDSVDIEAGEARLSFSLDGKRHEWNCEVDADWVDATILSKFANLLATRRTGRRFTYLDLGGQDCVLGCFTDAERIMLSSATGLAFEWLE